MHKEPYDKEEYEEMIYKQRKYLDPRIMGLEKLQPFVYREMHMYPKAEEQLSLADRS